MNYPSQQPWQFQPQQRPPQPPPKSGGSGGLMAILSVLGFIVAVVSVIIAYYAFVDPREPDHSIPKEYIAQIEPSCQAAMQDLRGLTLPTQGQLVTFARYHDQINTIMKPLLAEWAALEIPEKAKEAMLYVLGLFERLNGERDMAVLAAMSNNNDQFNGAIARIRDMQTSLRISTANGGFSACSDIFA